MQRPRVTSAFFLCLLIQSVSCGWNKRCTYLPLQRYIQFHTQQRGRPDAKYIIYTCKEHGCYGIGRLIMTRITVVHPTYPKLAMHEDLQMKLPCACLHAGDRARAVLFLGRLAAATGRVLLIDWTFPTSLDTYLQPSLVNWSIEGLAIPEHHHKHHGNSSVLTDATTSLQSNHGGSTSLDNRRLLRNVHSDQPSSSTDDAAASSTHTTSTGPHSSTDSSSVHSSMYIPLTDTVQFLQHLASREAFEAAYSNVTYLRVQTNLPAQHPLPWLPEVDMASIEPVCWWAALFQPSEALTQGEGSSTAASWLGCAVPTANTAMHTGAGHQLGDQPARHPSGCCVAVAYSEEAGPA
jgi:hypothetical protein